MTTLAQELQPSLIDFINRSRWFGGKGRDVGVEHVEVVTVRSGEPRITIALVTLAYDDGSRDLYQIPLSSYAEPQERLGHALVTVLGDRHVYDAVHDRVATQAWLEAFDAAGRGELPKEQSADGDVLRFHRTGDHELDLTTHSTLFSGEQSNSSLAFGEDALMKIFRRVTPGVNPDIEIHEALSARGSDHVAELYGWAELDREGDEPLQLAMLQQFLRTASDGWDLALASARNLFAEADLHADEVGGDFAAEAHRLGNAVAEVHAILLEEFGAFPFDPGAAAEGMRARLEAATVAVPALAELAPGVEAAFDRLRSVPGEAQRVHGDLHLGQTLRTSLGWKLVDFEGEPAKPLAERQLPDSPWRDVAGMLRSFDYAARSVAQDLFGPDGANEQIAYRAQEWVARNRAAFLAGYAEGRGTALSEGDDATVAAYEADKAVYEAVYEARNRPGWISIPLGALQRIGGAR